MARPAATTGSVLARAARNADALRQQNAQTPSHASSATDVMSHTYQGLADRVRSPGDVLGGAVMAVPHSVAGIARGVAGTWQSQSPSSVESGMRAQAGLIGKQVTQLFHQGDGPPPEGILQHVGAVFGALTSLEQLISMPLSMIPFPALPAVRIMDFDVGLPHAHMHPPNLTPPNPVPVPLPSTGPVIPIPILSGAVRTIVNGMPAARCGDLGLGIWCGGFFPMYEIFLGSSNVWIEGARAARVGVDITKHCIFTTPRPSDPPVGPMVGFTVSSSPNVSIGGIPMPSLLSMAMGALFKALFKGLAKVLNRAVERSIHKAGGPGVLFSLWRMTMPSWRLSRTARGLLQLLRRDGDRVSIVAISVRDLADMTRHAGVEFAVVETQHGTIDLVRGSTASVSANAGDQFLVHTHPNPMYEPHQIGVNPNYPNGVPGSDVSYATNATEGVINSDGSLHHFNNGGELPHPSPGTNPVNPNGVIDGGRH